jgi:ParB/RepB/Spo0J family partition protein
VRTLKTIVAGKDIRDEGQARVAFWERLEASNGGRLGDPRDYIEITGVTQEAGGFVFRYEVPAELLEKGVQLVSDAVPERPLQKCHVLSCLNPCIEGSSYCAEHQDKESRAEARGAPTTTENVEPVFERIDKEQPVPVKDVLITGWNPRKAFDGEAMRSLADDIRQNDLINAVTVRPKGKSKYELVSGERRLRAFRLLGRAMIPAKVRELTDEQMLDIMLAENLQRVDLNPIEEAHHLKRVLEVGKLTQTELGKRVGRSQEWVANRLRLATAPATLQDEIIRRRINPSSAIDLLGWVNTEHFNGILGAILRELGDDETEISRARVREIIGQITEPEHDHHCNECGNSHDSGDGVRVVCAHHGVVNGKGRGCEKWIERKPRAATSDISVAPPSNTDVPEASELPFANAEDCKCCEEFDAAANTCSQGCTNAVDCVDCYSEKVDDPLTPEEEADVAKSLEDIKAGRSDVIPSEVSDEEFMARIERAPEEQVLPSEPEPVPETEKEPTVPGAMDDGVLAEAYRQRLAAAEAGADGVMQWWCNTCKASHFTVKVDRAENVLQMLQHLMFKDPTSKEWTRKHQDALYRVLRSIGEGGDTWALLQKLFHQAGPEAL